MTLKKLLLSKGGEQVFALSVELGQSAQLKFIAGQFETCWASSSEENNNKTVSSSADSDGF